MDSQENKHEEGFDFMGSGSGGEQQMNLNEQENAFMPMNAFDGSSAPTDSMGGMGAPMGQFNSQPNIEGLDGDLTPEESEQIAKVQA